MSGALATLALALCAVAGFALATSLLALVLWPLARRLARRSHPLLRARLALGFAVAPSALPLALLAVCLLPGMATSLGWHQDHCLHHPEHAHLCFAHPSLALSAPLAALLAAGLGALVVGAVRGASCLARSQRELAAQPLERAAELGDDVRRVGSARPFSVTVGLWRPRIWVSSALEEALPPRELAAVLEHERCHARRRDSLRALLAAVASLPHWPGLRRALRAELALACEQVCDEAAGRRLGDRLLVAEAILRVERLLARARGPRHPALAAFDGSAVAARVRSLAADAPAEPLRGSAWWLAPAALAAAIAAAAPLHHATEHLLGLLLRAL